MGSMFARWTLLSGYPIPAYNRQNKQGISDETNPVVCPRTGDKHQPIRWVPCWLNSNPWNLRFDPSSAHYRAKYFEKGNHTWTCTNKKHACNVWGKSNGNHLSEMSGTLIFDQFLANQRAEYFTPGHKSWSFLKTRVISIMKGFRATEWKYIS